MPDKFLRNVLLGVRNNLSLPLRSNFKHENKYRKYDWPLRSVSSSLQQNCNCRKRTDCPLSNNCLSNSSVYKAEVKSFNGEFKEYIGMTANRFKERNNNHRKSFNLNKYEKETELSKFIWKLKKNHQKFSISWSILKRAGAYTSGGKRCNLCIEEKLCIMSADPQNF